MLLVLLALTGLACVEAQEARFTLNPRDDYELTWQSCRGRCSRDDSVSVSFVSYLR